MKKIYKVGIMGAGNIATHMAQTINKMDGVSCYAVASRSKERAKEFAKNYDCSVAYGNYEELVADKEVDLVYVATPHSEHANNMKLCIQYKKPVLCEKSFTVNKKQAEEIFALAKAENVLVADAVWTRYMPMMKVMKEKVFGGLIGEPVNLTANLSYNIAHVDRILDPELAGGALLDITIYPISFALSMFGNEIEEIVSNCTLTESGVDGEETIIFKYKDGKRAILNSSIYCLSDRKGIIHGTKGFAVIENINNFESITLYDTNHQVIETVERNSQISGYEYEIEECIKAIENQQLECDSMTHAETLEILEVLDIIRGQFGITYPFE